MKQLIGVIFVVGFTIISVAQPIIHIGTSKPYAIFNFMETAAGSQAYSPTLKSFINANISNDDTIFSKLVKDFTAIRLNYSIRRDEYPANRHSSRSTYDLLVIAAVNSTSLDAFRERTIGILPNTSHQELFRVLVDAEKYYDRIIWKEYKSSLNGQLKALEKYEGKANELFEKLHIFYQSGWSNDIPFNIALYPIPGSSGNTTATPHANSLCVGLLVGRKDLAGTMGVVIHEMCHTLYDEQQKSLQFEIDAAFTTDSSAFSHLSYGFFDEAMATVLGNGLAYEYFAGTMDTNLWYNNTYINGFAHALLPLTKEYLDKNKPMDTSFIKQAIALFGQTFPKALLDYSVLFNNMSIYTNADNAPERQQLRNTLASHFRVSEYHLMSPVLDESSIRSLKTGRQTQLIVVDRDHDSTMQTLIRIFPDMSRLLNGRQDPDYVLSFFDNQKRLIVVVHVKDKDTLDRAFRLLKEKKFVDVSNPYWPVRSS